MFHVRRCVPDISTFASCSFRNINFRYIFSAVVYRCNHSSRLETGSKRGGSENSNRFLNETEAFQNCHDVFTVRASFLIGFLYFYSQTKGAWPRSCQSKMAAEAQLTEMK